MIANMMWGSEKADTAHRDGNALSLGIGSIRVSNIERCNGGLP